MTTVVGDAGTPAVGAAELERLLAEVSDASARLAERPEVDGVTREFVRALPERLGARAARGSLPGDPFLVEQVYAGLAVSAVALLESDPGQVRRSLRLGLEQVRQALRDLVEARPSNEDAPAAEVVQWLEDTLGASQVRLASLVGAAPRTWQRWKAAEQVPDEVAALRLRRLAAVVAQLRHTLTAPGVLVWFERPHPALKAEQGTPGELLDDADGYRLVLDLAARLRTMTAG